MSSLSLNIATNALLTHRAMMDVIGNNIANVNTAGYRRRVTHLASTGVPHARYGSLGTGVTVAEIERKQATFLMGRFRAESSAVSEYGVRSGYLTRVESQTNEPSDSAIGASLDAFFGAYAKLSSNPTESGLKQDIVGKATQLADAMRRFRASLDNERGVAQEELSIRVEEANAYLENIAELNGQIQQAEVGGAEAMDLRDRRDELLDRLSELAPIRTSEDADGMVTISMSGRTLVQRTSARELVTHRNVVDGELVTRVTVDGQGDDMEFDGGALGALQELHDETLPRYIEDLDRLAARFIEEVNAVHMQGSSGVPLFEGTSAADIAVSTPVRSDPSLVAVSSSGDPSANDIALLIADLAEQNLPELGDRNFGAFYRDFVVGIGADSSAAQFGLEARQATFEQVLAQREQVEAVSIDEEMANMIAAQHAYEAAARLMTTASEMIETLISIG